MTGASAPYAASSRAPDDDRADHAGDDHADSLDVLEWDRLRSYLRAKVAPLAIIEVESQQQADSAFAVIGEIAGDAHVHVFRAREGQDFRRSLDWLEQQDDDDGVFVLTGFEAYTADESSRQQFWTWANAQRERWPRASGKVVFLLQPSQVDALCRYAPMLWDWIPLKFNLIRVEHARHRAPRSAVGMKTAIHGVASAQAVSPEAQARSVRRLRTEHIAKLKRDLLRAREKGLSEHIVVRDYALPLFQGLIEAQDWDAARRVLESDLGYEFPTELPWTQARDTISLLQTAFARLGLPERANTTLRASQFYLRGGEPWTEIVDFLVATVFVLFAQATTDRGDEDGTEAWARCAVVRLERGGPQQESARVHLALARLARDRRDLKSAKRWGRKALERFEDVGDVQGATRAFVFLAAIELARRAPPTMGPPTSSSGSRSALHGSTGPTPGRVFRGLMAVVGLAEKVARIILKPEQRTG